MSHSTYVAGKIQDELHMDFALKELSPRAGDVVPWITTCIAFVKHWI